MVLTHGDLSNIGHMPSKRLRLLRRHLIDLIIHKVHLLLLPVLHLTFVFLLISPVFLELLVHARLLVCWVVLGVESVIVFVGWWPILVNSI